MKKSLYKKFYGTFLAVTLAAFCLLGSMVLMFSGHYWQGQNKKLLVSHAQTVAEQIQQAARYYSGAYLTQYAEQMAAVIARAGDCQVLVVNREGEPVTAAGGYSTGAPVDSQALSPFLTQSATVIGSLSGALSEDCLVAAVPLTLNGEARGVVFTALPMNNVGEFTRTLLRLLLIAALVAAVLLCLAAYAMASALVRPLKQMSVAAGCLARGDFSHRVAVNRQDELGQLARAFNHMTGSLQAGENLRRGFVANVSHELKTPMTTIAGFVDGILDGTIPQERQKEYLSIVSGEVKRLSRLVDTMLSLSKLEAGEVRLQPAAVDLTQTAIQSALLLEPRISEKELTLTGLSELPPLWATADPDLITQVIYNLLDNAVKYTPPGGTVTLRGEGDARTVRLCVRNTGQGIPPADLPYVFDRFYKVDRSRGADKNSLGLGLYLVKTIVTLHRGTVTVRSIQDEYCEFEVVLAAAGSSADRTASAPERSLS